MHFNSQSHEETDYGVTIMQIGYDISIHSLTKRLTGNTACLNIELYISIHSLTKRLTRERNYYDAVQRYFNSQSHEETDKNLYAYPFDFQYFNSQSHEETD